MFAFHISLPTLTQPLNLILNYSLFLQDKLNLLQVKIISLENAKLPESLASSNVDLNVYVRIELMAPLSTQQTLTSVSERKTAKTRLIKNRSNPIYDESFEFTGLRDLYANLASTTTNPVEEESDEFKRTKSFRLVFNVCNSNLFGRDQIIGQTVHTILRADLFNSEFVNKAIIVNDNVNKCMSSSSSSSSSNDKKEVDADKNNTMLMSLPRIYSRKVDLVDSKVYFSMQNSYVRIVWTT